jgi:hypothetical protein
MGAAHQAVLDSAIEAGTLTQEQADARLELMNSHIQAMLDGTMTPGGMMGGQGMGMGMMHGHGMGMGGRGNGMGGMGMGGRGQGMGPGGMGGFGNSPQSSATPNA